VVLQTFNNKQFTKSGILFFMGLDQIFTSPKIDDFRPNN